MTDDEVNPEVSGRAAPTRRRATKSTSASDKRKASTASKSRSRKPTTAKGKRGSSAGSKSTAPRKGRGSAAKKRPTTLVELYADPKATPADLLIELNKAKRWSTSESDKAKALAQLESTDFDLSKTKALAFRAAAGYEGRFASSLESFLADAAGKVIGPSTGWLPSDGADPNESFDALLAVHRGDLAGDEGEQRLFNAVMTALVVLATGHRLDVGKGLASLHGALGKPKALRKPSSNPRPLKLKVIGESSKNAEALRQSFSAFESWREEIAASERDRERNRLAAVEARARLEDARTEMAGLSVELEAREQSIAELAEKLEEAEQRARAARLQQGHAESSMRGTMGDFLDREAKGLLSDVRDALTLDPPRTSFALQQIGLLEQGIKEKLEWLKSSD